jgi:hypothetical protein
MVGTLRVSDERGSDLAVRRSPQGRGPDADCGSRVDRIRVGFDFEEPAVDEAVEEPIGSIPLPVRFSLT